MTDDEITILRARVERATTEIGLMKPDLRKYGLDRLVRHASQAQEELREISGATFQQGFRREGK